MKRIRILIILLGISVWVLAIKVAASADWFFASSGAAPAAMTIKWSDAEPVVSYNTLKWSDAQGFNYCP